MSTTYSSSGGVKVPEKPMRTGPQKYCACGEKILSGKKCFDCKENTRIEREHAHKERVKAAREQSKAE